jgi:S-layer protein
LGSYTSVSSSASAGTLTLSNFANGGTLTITGATVGTGYTLTNTAFTAGTTDSVNIAITAAVAAGTVSAASVETVNISASKAGASSLTLTDSAAKSIVVTGAGTLTLTSANTSVTSVDASAMTGSLVYTTAGTTAETVKGGVGANNLTAAAGTVADTLIGGAGADTLTANKGMNILTGGAGADLFVIGSASSNLNSYATITDAAAGDRIQLSATGTLAFAQSKVTLGSTAVFQDYANTAVSTGGGAAAQGNIAWFQFSGDTYVIQHQVAGAETAFENGVDMIVKLTGLVDLSTTSLNPAGATLLIG